MLSNEQLAQLKLTLAYDFSDNDYFLKYNLTLFCFYCITHEKEHLPFLDTITVDDWQPIISSDFFAQCRSRKKELHFFIYHALKKLGPNDSQSERKSYFEKFTKEKNILQLLVDKFTLSALLSQEDSLAQELLPKIALFICNAVFQDAKRKEQPEIAIEWLSKLLKMSYEEMLSITPLRSQYQQMYLFEPQQPNFAIGVGGEAIRCFELGFMPNREVIMSYEASVLGLSLPDIHSSMPLPELGDRFEPTPEGRSKYFKQFIPYIIEETRESIATQYKQVKQKKLPSFTITLTAIPQPDDIGAVVECTAKAKQLPKLDHTFAMEAVLIRQVVQGSRIPLETLAIASIKYYDKKEKVTILRLYVKKESLALFSNLFTVNQIIKLHWLAGLISFSRMHEVCLLMPKVPFSSQLLTACLPSWPVLDEFTQLEALPAQDHLNKKQLETVARFYQAPPGLYFLLGPPGTGKTTTIVNLFRLLVQNPTLKILVCAPSNKAVRVLAERTCLLLPDLEIALTGVAKELPPELRRIFINDRASQLFLAVEAPYLALQEVHEELLGALNLAQPITRNIGHEISHLLEALRLSIIQIIELCYHLYAVSSPFQLDYQARFSVQKLYENLSAFSLDLLEAYQLLAQDYHEKLNQGRFNAFPTLAASRQQSRRRKHEISTTLSISDAIVALEQAFENFALPLQANMSLISNIAESIEILLLQRAQIVFCTLVSSGRKWLKKHVPKVDVLIVDEAAQAVEPELLIPFKFLPKKCLQVGDTKQLPATVLSKQAQSMLYDRSMMFRLIETCGQYCSMLTIQYRMHPAICAWPSSQNYQGLLVADPSLVERVSPLSDKPVASVLKNPCVFFNVKGNEDRRGMFTQSIKNPIEATAVIEVLSYLVQVLPPKALGVISFYAAQIQLLKQKAAEYKGPNAKALRQVQISTVDGFQGGEKEVILASTVRTVESVGFLRDFRRINVAMTRSKHHLFCFGNSDTLEQSDSDFSALIKHYRKPSNADCSVVEYSACKFT